MSDPIATILTTAAEHAPSAVAAAAALKAAKGFLAKVVGPAVEEIGEIGRDYIKGWRAKNGSQTLAEAGKLLAETGREPQAVPLKTLLPLLDSASLEDEPGMAARWAALLANAADPAQRVQVQPGFAEVLRQLTPMEARLLTFIYRNTAPDVEGDETLKRVEGDASTRVDLARPLLKISAIELQGAIDNLLRLRLCKVPEGAIGGNELLHETFLPVYRVAPTVFGYQFMQAVTPPTP